MIHIITNKVISDNKGRVNSRSNMYAVAMAVCDARTDEYNIKLRFKKGLSSF